MKGVDTIARIRREFFTRGRAIKDIVRGLHVSRNTVRKVIRSGATAFTYERDVQPLPKLGPWRDDLDRMLTTNAGRSARERLTLIRIYEALRGLGYEGGYDAVRRYAKTWKRERASVTAQAFVPLIFAPGEAYQFDWSHEIVLIGGTTVTVKVVHVRLCHSRMLFVRAYAERIEIQQGGRVVAEHARAFGRDQTVFDPWHYVPVLARKPGALRNGAPFKDWMLPATLDRVRRKLAGSTGGDRQMVEILTAVLGAGLLAVEAACAEALREGVHSADVVLNILARQREPTTPVTILTPESLRLRHEPVADCARYDSLRRAP
ncbi:protein of unknown function [Methylorubrum extorquens]|uniref:Transposase for insertion sequence element IS21-like C-terminal domain-containing protein n=1 Tax=Methylorubrum extorquens TaxID=408 RepID=A0A2N9AZD8_METEX|nr:hypothetical protein ASF59_21380 [Methylobacterium sp. Leaf121]SOR32692.1 protein of unknown function [Methylorubrum extorquens]